MYADPIIHGATFFLLKLNKVLTYKYMGMLKSALSLLLSNRASLSFVPDHRRNLVYK